MPTAQKALAYQEPDITTILIQSCFLLALNVVNSVLDKLIYCGLIGQLLIGMAWGIPGANWLDLDMQQAIQQLGYLGLILLVYEGGLSTSFSQLKANFLFSALVALTGVGVPMALSFTLLDIVSATPLQAFAAGASLCSTSIGTTFTILTTTGLAKTRLGVVLGGAAMMDDVAGLVMVQIISNLGRAGSNSSFKVTTVIRPIFVAIGFALGLLLFCRFVVAVAVRKLQARKIRLPRFVKSLEFAFVIHMGLLIGIVTAATYAGTSPLFAAYLSGACISWFCEILGDTNRDTNIHNVNDSDVARQTPATEIQYQPTEKRNNSQSGIGYTDSSMALCQHETGQTPNSVPTGEQVFQHFCKQPLDRILKPLFFASIGFSIPITQMFHKEIVWRGIVYTLLMGFGKIITGIWLIRVSTTPSSILGEMKRRLLPAFFFFCKSSKRKMERNKEKNKSQPHNGLTSTMKVQERQNGKEDDTPPETIQNRLTSPTQKPDPKHTSVEKMGDAEPAQGRHNNNPNNHNNDNPPVSQAGNSSSSSRLPSKPRSLYPASILGLAMVARGEIGFLVASLAESDGIFAEFGDNTNQGSSEMYLVVIWAITLCTIVGPICVGTVVRRVKALQAQRVHSGMEDPLGVWGVCLSAFMGRGQEDSWGIKAS